MGSNPVGRTIENKELGRFDVALLFCDVGFFGIRVASLRLSSGKITSDNAITVVSPIGAFVARTPLFIRPGSQLG